MKPVDLTLDGFRSYAGTATFSWEGRRLVGIVGPIGSGKSTILDGIAFALYGKTPRVERDVRSLINQRRDEGKVSLTFDVDGQRWRAVRALRRKGASAHTLYRVVDGEPVEEADRAREMTERVAELLGLDWDAFCRSVLLAQNQFAGFLEATGTERNEVLKGVFAFEDLDAMRQVVRGWLDESGRALARLATLRDQAARDRADLAAAAEQQAVAAARVDGLEGISAEVASAEEVRAAAERALIAAAAQRDRLNELAEALPDRRRVDELVGRAAEGDAALTAADRALRDADLRSAEARRALQEALVAAGGREALEEAARLVVAMEGELRAADLAAEQARQAAGGVREADRAVRDAEAAALAAVAEAADAEGALDAATATVATARRRLHEARHGAMAASLRAELVVGESCPVCDRPVTSLPAAALPDDVVRAEQALAEAEAAESDARLRATRSSADLAGARTRGEEAGRLLTTAQKGAAEAAERAATAAQAVGSSRDRLGAMLGPGDPEALLEGRRSAVVAAEGAVGEADEGLHLSRKQRDRAAEEARDARDGLGALATELARIAGRLDVDLEVRADPSSVSAALRRVRRAWVDASRMAVEAVDAAEARAREAVERRAALLEGVGLGAGEDFGGALGEARSALAGVHARIEVLEGRLGDLERLEQEEGDTVRRHETLDRLHGDLAPSRFQAFVLDEYRRALADLGSEQFEVLSGGRYRFTEDGTFDVIDLMAAEQTRAADSLSGGETFLASLALALALAEMVARQGGRLDAFFLDEGFGSLDAEHLDLAMEGVERLVAGADRLVVVVSHVDALRERIEDLIELDKDLLTGATRVRSGAGR